MPIYEYVCARCDETTEFLERPGETIRRACGECGSRKLRKAFSTFAAHSKTPTRQSTSSGSSRCANCGTGACANCRH